MAVNKYIDLNYHQFINFSLSAYILIGVKISDNSIKINPNQIYYEIHILMALSVLIDMIIDFVTVQIEMK